MLTMPGQEPAQVTAIVVDTRRFLTPGRTFKSISQYLPRTVAVSVSDSADANDLKAFPLTAESHGIPKSMIL